MKTDPKLRLIAYVAGFLGGATLLVTGTILLLNYGPGNMGHGFAVGGTLALAGFAFALWRAVRKPQKASSLERVLAHTADERDNRVATQAAAVVGVVAIVAASFAAVAIAIGAPAEIVSFALVYLLLAVATVSFVVTLRRN